MIASYGIIEIKTDTDTAVLIKILEKYDGITSLKMDLKTVVATLGKEVASSDINKYLFDNGIIVSHLVKRKPTLEQQFLDLTNNKKY